MADDMTSHDMIDVSGEAEPSKIPQDELNRITDDLITAFKTVFDPEIPVDIYELGLIYRVDIDNDYNVAIDMTLTAPGCPVAGDMPQWIQQAVERSGHSPVHVELTFDPPWNPDMISEDGRLYLGM